MGDNKFVNKVHMDDEKKINVGYEEFKNVEYELNKGFEPTEKTLVGKGNRDSYLIPVTIINTDITINNDNNIDDNNNKKNDNVNNINKNNNNDIKKESDKHVNDTCTYFESVGDNYTNDQDFKAITRKYVNIDDSSKQNATYVGNNKPSNQNTYSKLEHKPDEANDDAQEEERYTSLFEDKNMYHKNSVYQKEEEIEEKKKPYEKGGDEVEIYEFANDVAPPKRELPAIPYDYVAINPSKKSKKIDRKQKIIILAIVSSIFLIIILALGLGLGLGLKNESNKRKYVGGTMLIPNIKYTQKQVIEDVIQVTRDCLEKSASFSSNFINIAVPAASFESDKLRYVTIFTMQGNFEIEKLSYYLMNECYLYKDDQIMENNSCLFSEVRVKVNLKMASTAKGSFRKVNVDEYTEEKFKEEEDENKISEEQINENEIQNLLQTGRNTDALLYLLENVNLNIKDPKYKTLVTRCVLKVVCSFKTSEVDQVISQLSVPSHTDLLMKFIYKGFEYPNDFSPAQLLNWHEKVFNLAGVGCVVRTLVDRKKL